MKIGIITLPLHVNYGGVIQNYALQKALIKLGYEPITLREKYYDGMHEMNTYQALIKWLIRIFKWCVKIIIGRQVAFPLINHKEIKRKKENLQTMEKFIKDNIVTTDVRTILSEEDVEKYDIQALIVGSDQVWHPLIPHHLLENQFCGFLKSKSINIISYAASFGTDENLFTKEQMVSCKKLVAKFSNVSIREETGVNQCMNYWNKEAIWVLDPTLLLHRSDYESLIIGVPKSKGKFVLAYILDKSKEKINFVKRLAKGRGMDFLILDCTITSNLLPIEKWLSYFRDAELVITDSYHGTIFSLIFEKEFLCLYNPLRGTSRMDSLLKITDLNDRFVAAPTEFPSIRINYSIVNSRIDIMRDKSIDFLKTSLHCFNNLKYE